MGINTAIVALALVAVFALALAGGFLVGEFLLKPSLPAAPAAVVQPPVRTLTMPTPFPAPERQPSPIGRPDVGTKRVEPVQTVPDTKRTPPPTPQPTPPPSSGEMTPAVAAALYRVQAGAFIQQENAEQLATQLRDAGFEAFVMKAGTLYRVQVGAFAERANAERLAERLRAIGYPAVILRQ